jgi:hypothetical protein
MRLQQQLQVQAKIERAYDDRLSGAISEEMWARRSSEWETEINQVRGDMARLEDAGRNYAVTGLRVLELAKNAYPRFNSHDPWDQASLLKMVLSNCTFDRGSLCPAYNKPLEVFARGNESLCSVKQCPLLSDAALAASKGQEKGNVNDIGVGGQAS